jgi:transcriptional regulator with XRE-family HTH domain
MFVTHPAYIREKARQMRMERDLTIDEIAERLAVSRTTVFLWVRDLPVREKRPSTAGQRLGAEAVRRKYKLLRDAAYEAGFEEYDSLIQEPTFRDFVCMYIGEGYKRQRNTVQLCNSDPKVVVLADNWIRRFASNPVRYSLQYHADQDPDELRRFWSLMLKIDPGSIRLQRKSNSNQLSGRTWRCRHGVLAVSCCDTSFRSRLQAWIDRIVEEWLDLPIRGA